ncbi:hypothetical protein E2C01_012024 [Portunus trituberculatus]|uniref:Uncharacterized protein n=1 Tax=Portunus trituberculatus TaxID=210409 RepID=A0A5B7DDE5_PORTR|nr:hypothetical protein [Portunus trituberculatus]
MNNHWQASVLTRTLGLRRFPMGPPVLVGLQGAFSVRNSHIRLLRRRHSRLLLAKTLFPFVEYPTQRVMVGEG